MQKRVMRDVLIEQIRIRMERDDKIFFISADFGAPTLDRLREQFPNRFLNVGIAEQNLVNVSTGLALEGFVVYAYTVSAFITMRCYEQIRTNLSLMSQTKPLNVNLIGVGAGISYNVSGPTHHCLEDISIMRLLPNFVVFSPSDCTLVENFVDYSLRINKPKYLRLEGKAVSQIYNNIKENDMENGFCELSQGSDVCLVSTGVMTHTILKIAKDFLERMTPVGVIDVFFMKPLNERMLMEKMKKYKKIITIEEAFINNGGLDSLIAKILIENSTHIDQIRIGFDDHHVFDLGSREYLHRANNLDETAIIEAIRRVR